ncbi:MAG: hypothetical protein IH598_08920 [Bacteroidales bacterium]|nr:hypothetical protein [Bacteroidales bacterium]
MKTRLKTIWKRISTKEYNARYSRLAGDIECYKPQLTRRVTEKNLKDAPWAKQAEKLVEKSEEFLQDFKIDEAWKAFHTAKRMEIFGMDDKERINLANELRMETAKLNEWRKDAVLELIGQKKFDMLDAPSHQALVRAVELKDEHYNNQYYKNRLSQTLFRLLFTLLSFGIAGIGLYFYYTIRCFGMDFNDPANIWLYLLGVLLFGLLGATTSAILFTRYLSSSSRITEIGSSRVITLSKIFVGAGFSVFIFLILRSSIAENIQIFSFSIKDPLDYFTVAFVSGFSERLAQKAIETIVGKEKEGEQNQKATETHES